ncbi:MAG: hypothetical protein QOD50_1725 [Actinomycetota bacterium]|jgi:hypothetical protein|nr:hypothetical protein [Actinomycetota bacterium]
MATTRTSGGSSLVGWFFLASGIVYLLGLLFNNVVKALTGGWWDFFAFALLAVGLFLLFLWRTDLLLRIAFIVGAVGWALLAVGSVAALGGVSTIAILLALIGTLVAGILVFIRHLFTRNADLVFLLMAIFAALLLLAAWVAFLGGTLGVIIAVIFGILLVVSGVFIQRRR